MRIKSLDHLVIPVKDIEKSMSFYTSVLGMEADISNHRYAVRFGDQKINLHVGKGEFLPAAANPEFGSADICLIAEGDIKEIKAELDNRHIPIEEGIVRRTGAKGPIDSIYLRDPDGNLIEISTYNYLSHQTDVVNKSLP
ncbi:VOC family protein [uncultured Parabacteroides sp.]|jgi:catechol 2,3-dioxygenase-like lactoylglutathione lyase family enzyme|uniref:VOC family protein n=1 Tax=uncultured Parabacteroides sp. TaxID=512312 RepID=UPI0025E33A85|nr:VOC family protein [uncultured Parabacteroides sp.]